MPARLILSLGICITLTACANISTTMQMPKEDAEALVQRLPEIAEKSVALAVLKHPDTRYRIDHHGYPAWTWRGADDIGACVHIHPETRRPYLETQFARKERTSVPKYIDFGTDGQDWMCRIHVVGNGPEIEKNWSTPACDRQGRKLLGQLATILNSP